MHSPDSLTRGERGPIIGDPSLMEKPKFECKRSRTKYSGHTLWLNYKRGLRPLSTLVIVIISTILTCIDATSGIIQDCSPITIVHTDDLTAQSFHGNQSHVDFFRLLQRDGDSILIGARNFVYNISIHDLTEHIDRRIEWVSRQIDSDICFSKGKSEAECHNYIRVLAKKDEGQFLVCGTNAYKPICRDYYLQSNGSFVSVETTGRGKCPYDPRHNSTFVYADGQLYSGTVVDFQGSIPLVFREPLKTDHNDYRQLNAPDFVHSFEYGNYVFFFLRETAVEYMNCGKKVFSRVARVCKDDKGVASMRSTTKSTWTSFLKSRLNCSFPGEFPFYFDEIQSVSDVVLGRYGGGSHNEIIYAIFTTPQNSIPGSAVCAFSMRDILDSFDGSFKEQKDLNSNWLPVPQHKVPFPRPGSCVNDSKTLKPEIINFVRAHPLMDELVPPFHGEPVLMKSSFNFRFTKIAVDPQVKLLTGGFVDVLYVATDDGKILKVVNNPTEEKERRATPIIIEEVHVFPTPVAIINLQIARHGDGDSDSKLVIITDSEVKAIPLERCHKANSCGKCIALQDPYCGWFINQRVCGPVTQMEEENILQNISSGIHQLCPYDHENDLNPSTTQFFTTGSHVEYPTLVEEVNEITGEDHLLSNQIPVVSYPGGRLPQPILPTRAAGRIGKELFVTSGPPNDAPPAPSQVTGPVVGASMDGPLIYSAETLAIAVTTVGVAALVIGFIGGFLFQRKCQGDHYPAFSDTPYLDSKLNKCENSADPNMYTANNANLPSKQLNNLATNYKNTNKTSNTSTTDSKLMKPAKCAYI